MTSMKRFVSLTNRSFKTPKDSLDGIRECCDILYQIDGECLSIDHGENSAEFMAGCIIDPSIVMEAMKLMLDDMSESYADYVASLDE